MALEHAILVSLDERSGTGYELARRFAKSIGFFWAATHQQIYRTLKRMADLGWVSVREVAQHGRPDKKVYAVAGPGQAELRRWLAEPGGPEHFRHDLAVKVRGASLGDAAALVAEVGRHRARHAERLDAYLAMAAQDFPDPTTLTGRPLHQYLVLSGGIRTERAMVEWCDEVLTALREDTRP
ncbi:PadR family transcriptional regulator [Saccharothrix syringae]|uniref:PadR family transcriptional regulator n=1 Tax=Saccharothrix syringae TaxID=103733 RepID=A0A5Q0H0P5_SACSY|nr:PadR family transcriptional regulator [Saccharothrix syringae]QFZ19434.1 PadR family transcriptional regulator [Saccharothrix syringae]